MLSAFRVLSRRRLALLLSGVVILSLNPVLARPAEAVRPETEADRAVASGERVEVMSERTEFSQVFAEPSGRLVMESTVVPKRVRHGDGTWSDVDLNVSVQPDGTVRPGASVADVRFSGGGAGPMLTLNGAGKTLELSWPGELPEPVVSGDSATYPEVLAGVDLVLRATWTGFTHVLVVKTPEAVESVASVTVGVGGDASVERTPEGRLRAVAGRTVLATASPPVMWDSAALTPETQAHATQARAAQVPASDSTHAGPGMAANTAAVRTELTAQGDLQLIPDEAMLASPEQHFPLFIDPAWDAKPLKWSYATNNNVDNWNLNARVGYNPGSAHYHRSFFRFPTGDLGGKYIHSARVQMKLDHSWSCTDTPTSMWWSDAIGMGNIGLRVPWSTRLMSGLAVAYSHGNEADGCGNKQEDMTVQFESAAVRAKVQDAANNRHSDLTVGFCGCDLSGAKEGYAERWKTFFPEHAVLVVDYDSVPGMPDSMLVEPNTNCGVPISTGTLTPRLYARLPDADGMQKLAATFEWKQIPAGQVNDTTYPVSTATVSDQTANALSSPVTVTIENSKRYAFRVQSRDPAPYNQSSPWTAWCEFYADTTVPDEVVITRTSAVPGPGGEAAFTLSTPALDVTRFRYGWKNPPDREIAATLTTAADGSKAMTAQVKLSTVKYGENIFTAYAIDNTLNNGRSTSVSLLVKGPSGPIARYGLQSYPGVDQSAALQNGVKPGAGNALVATDLSWTDDVRIIGGRTATFTGAASQGAVAPDVVLNTTSSYSVAAWVRLPDLTETSTLISKGAPTGASSPFRLRARPLSTGGNAWCLLIPSTASAPGTEVCSTRRNTADQWTHVAAGFDSIDKRIKVWVDGVETAAAFNAPTTNAEPMVIGRGQDAGTTGPVERLRGNVADVQVFDRLLVTDDFTGVAGVRTEDGEVDEPGILDSIEVGHWTFNDGVSCYDESEPGFCEALADDLFSRRLRTTLGTVIDFGRHGQSMFLDTEPVEGGTTGAPTHEFAQSQRNVGTTGTPVWQNTPVLRTDQSFTVSAWVDPADIETGVHTILSQDGPDRTPFVLSYRPLTVDGVTSSYWTFSMLPATGAGGDAVRSLSPLTYEGTAGWTHLVAVHDATRKQLRLYVNGVLQGTVDNRQPGWQASGPLTVGGALFNGQRTDRWHGGIDDVRAYQGALTDARVRDLFDSEILAAVS